MDDPKRSINWKMTEAHYISLLHQPAAPSTTDSESSATNYWRLVFLRSYTPHYVSSYKNRTESVAGEKEQDIR